MAHNYVECVYVDDINVAILRSSTSSASSLEVLAVQRQSATKR